MNRRSFLVNSLAATAAGALSALSSPIPSSVAPATGEARVAVLLVDTDRVTFPIDQRIYGQFLEHINHSVEDGLFAEQIRGAGFEGEDFKTYWKMSSDRGRVEIAEIVFQNGKKSVRLDVDGGHASIQQGRLFLDAGIKYDGSLWIKREKGSPQLTLRMTSSTGAPIASIPLTLSGSDWQELPYSFTSSVRDTQAVIEVSATGHGTLLLDFISMMRADVRSTQWERPVEQYGWGNSRAIVMMKSWDLVHWTHSDFRVDKAFPELGDISTAWAPETIYDKQKGKMMVYFSIRFGAKGSDLYYAYADTAFTKLETKPQLLAKVNGVDGDITQVGNKFHLFYVSDAKVRHGISDSLHDGYQLDPQRIDPETVSTEAPTIFKRLGTSTYVLMYDVYGARPNNMGFSETTDFATYKNLGHFNEGVMKTTNFTGPKHGAVTYLTKDELKAVAQHWNVKLEEPNPHN